IVVYLLLFLTAFMISGYLLMEVLHAQPILLIELLKYTLLFFLFIILMLNSIKAMSLRQFSFERFISSIENFKWLFTIVLLICFLVRFGFIKGADQKIIDITNLQIIAVTLGAVFCFWSNYQLHKTKKTIFTDSLS
ncbi:MAG: hypothetical protein MUP99_10385, partial [Pedobacter sp.]|nr:hypothetical protein [Pedobacter sp.]